MTFFPLLFCSHASHVVRAFTATWCGSGLEKHALINVLINRVLLYLHLLLTQLLQRPMLLVLLPWLLVVLDKLNELASLASYDGSEDASSFRTWSIYIWNWVWYHCLPCF